MVKNPKKIADVKEVAKFLKIVSKYRAILNTSEICVDFTDFTGASFSPLNYRDAKNDLKEFSKKIKIKEKKENGKICIPYEPDPKYFL